MFEGIDPDAVARLAGDEGKRLAYEGVDCYQPFRESEEKNGRFICHPFGERRVNFVKDPFDGIEGEKIRRARLIAGLHLFPFIPRVE